MIQNVTPLSPLMRARNQVAMLLASLEAFIAKHGGGFAVGSSLTVIMPQAHAQ